MSLIMSIIKAAGIGVAATVGAPVVVAVAGVSSATATVGIGLAGAVTVFGNSDDEIRREGYEQGLLHGMKKGCIAI